MFDLLTKAEEEIDERTAEFRFNIPLLAGRLIVATRWLKRNPSTKKLPLGYCGASTGAATALIAAAQELQPVQAIVSRGGRPDLAGDFLPDVKAPTLFIIGSLDTEVIILNKEAAKAMAPKPRITIVPGATHLFEEPGKLKEVAILAAQWFRQHLKKK